jgi:serine/threonine protein kinase
MPSEPIQPERGEPGAPEAPVAAETRPTELAEHPDYEVIRKLGGGGMGVVYLVHNRLMGRDEVLKVISPQFIERPGALDRFHREIRAVARLRHPNIVSAYTAFRSGASMVFAMEYVEGLDLARMVKALGPMPVSHACSFARQAALGLQHAHELGMVHRDIKPSNLMLSRDRDRALIKVLDFGLAKAERENLGRDKAPTWPDGPAPEGAAAAAALTATGQLIGTPGYVAPEQILDAQGADIRADIYSLGCTLYYLISGRPPFETEPLYDLLQAHHSMAARPLDLVRPGVPAELAAVVAKMMAKSPGDRFEAPDDVARALSAFLKVSDAASWGPAPRETRGEQTTVAWPLTAPGPERSAEEPSTREGDSLAHAARPRAWVWPSLAAAVFLLAGLSVALLRGSIRSGGDAEKGKSETAVPTLHPAAVAARPTDAPKVPHHLAPAVPVPPGAGTLRDPPALTTAPPPPAAPPAVSDARLAPGNPPARPRPDRPPQQAAGAPRSELEAILARKGLKRLGPSYVLVDHEELAKELQRLDASANEMQLSVQQTESQQAAAREEFDRAQVQLGNLAEEERAWLTMTFPVAETGVRDRLEQDRQAKLRELGQKRTELEARREALRVQDGLLRDRAARLARSLQSVRAGAEEKLDGIRGRYASLAADPEVEAAIREVNKQGSQRVVLGPIEDLKDYLDRSRRDAEATLRGLGLLLVRGTHPQLRLAPGAAREVAQLTNAVRDAWRGPELLAHRRDGLQAELARAANDEERKRLVPQLDAVEALLAQPRTGPKAAANAANRRGEFVHGVASLRLAADTLQSRIQLLEEDSGVQKAWLSLPASRKAGSKPPERPNRLKGSPREEDRGAVRITRPIELAQALRLLEEVEPWVQTTSVPFRKDGDGRWVEATLNGRKAVALLVDPKAEAAAGGTLLPASLASEVGASVANEAATENFTAGGRRVTAQRATLSSLQVGRYSVKDTPCLVLLDEVKEREGAPMLGRPFLDRFGATLDEAAGALILGELRTQPAASGSSR